MGNTSVNKLHLYCCHIYIYILHLHENSVNILGHGSVYTIYL
jgi:hypothetical protein